MSKQTRQAAELKLLLLINAKESFAAKRPKDSFALACALALAFAFHCCLLSSEIESESKIESNTDRVSQSF